MTDIKDVWQKECDCVFMPGKVGSGWQPCNCPDNKSQFCVYTTQGAFEYCKHYLKRKEIIYVE